MRPSERAFIVAVGASVVLHFTALFGIPRFDLGARIDAAAPPPPIEARLIPPPAPVAAAPKRAPEVRRPARRTAPAPLPLAQDSVVPRYEYPEGPFEGVASASGDVPLEQVDVSAAESTATIEPSPAPAEYPLRHATLVFDLYYGAQPSKVGQVTHTWAQDGHAYRVETIAEAVGFVSLFFNGRRLVQHSSGVLTADGLLPTEYRAELGTRERTEVARFDWAGGKIALTSRGENRLLDLPAGAQDPLSMLHQLYFMKPIPAAARLDIATGRKLYQYVYRIVGETQIETPLGLVRALQMRNQEPDGSGMDVWLDLDRSLLPVRIHAVDRRGRVLEQVIREVRLEVAAAE
jgi:hypothetical protein